MEEFEDAGGVVRIEVASGFVGQEEGGAVHEGAGDGGALHLAAAHLVGEGAGAGSEADEVEHLGGTGAGVLGAVAAQKEGELDIFQGGHGGQEVEKLEDDAEAFAAVGGEGGFVGAVEREAVDRDLAAGRLVKSAEQVEQGAFAAAAGAGHGTE